MTLSWGLAIVSDQQTMVNLWPYLEVTPSWSAKGDDLNLWPYLEVSPSSVINRRWWICDLILRSRCRDQQTVMTWICDLILRSRRRQWSTDDDESVTLSWGLAVVSDQQTVMNLWAYLEVSPSSVINKLSWICDLILRSRRRQWSTNCDESVTLISWGLAVVTDHECWRPPHHVTATFQDQFTSVFQLFESQLK